MLYKIYIGSNNKTKRLESKKAIRIATKQFQGFTAYKGLGYWQGKKENSLILEIETNKKKDVLKLVKNLATGLNQEAIGLARIGKLQFIA